MLFKDVIGQDKAKKGLVSLYNTGKMPHAIMLLAKEGFGGLPFALAFAQYILCSNKQDLDSCGTCSSCMKLNKLAHPDVHFTFPTISPKPGVKASSKIFLNEFRQFIVQTPYGTTYDWLQYINAENKQGNITAEECREIIDTLNLKSFEGGYKIQIIWRPEYLGKEGNILLKLIEEPPFETLILMIAEDTESVLKTILSRTQQFILPPISTEEIANHLVIKQKLNALKASQVAQIAEGSYSNALDVLRHTDHDMLEILKDWFNAIFTNKGIEISNWIEERAKTGRENQKNFLHFTQQIMGQALRVTQIPNYQPPLSEEEADFCKKLASRNLAPEIFQELDHAINKTIFHIERNAHSKTQFLYLSIQIQYLIQGKVLSIHTT